MTKNDFLQKTKLFDNTLVGIVIFLFLSVIYTSFFDEPSLYGDFSVQRENRLIYYITIAIEVILYSLGLFIYLKTRILVTGNVVGIVMLYGKPIFEVKNQTLSALPILWSFGKHEIIFDNTIPNDLFFSKIKITHGVDVSSNDPLSAHRITTLSDIVLKYKITNFVDFYSNATSREQVYSLFKDKIISALNFECAKNGLGTNLGRRVEINEILFQSLSLTSKSWGIEILSCYLDDFDLGEVGNAIREVTLSSIAMGKYKNEAQKRVFEGVAEAEVHKAFQYARADGFKIIAEKLNIDDAKAIYYVETIANAWRKSSNNSETLYTGDMAEVLKMIASFAHFDTQQKKQYLK